MAREASLQQKLDLELRGLWTTPNNFSAVPPGALDVANNVVLNSKSIIESRRGQTQYGDPLSIGSGQVNKLFNYSASLIAHFDNKMGYDAGLGVWMTYPGTYEAPSALNKMRSLEALQNFYFTTTQGIYKIDALGATPRPAGVVKALGGESVLTGSGGFLPDDSAVAYRVVWGYVDANNNLLLGSPSERLVVINSSGGAKDVELTFPIPDGITTEYFYQIYRSDTVTPATVAPSDELQLVIQSNPSSGEITAKSFTTTDSTPWSLARATLYTSPSQQGIANSNVPPPQAVDMDVFKTCAFYVNTKNKQSLSEAIISVASPSLGYVIAAACTTTNASANVGGIADTSILRVGMRVIGTGIQSDSRIQSIAGPNSIVMTKTATATSGPTVSLEFQDRVTLASTDYFAGSAENVSTNTFLAEVGGTPATNINETAISLVRVVNTSASNTAIYAYYVSGPDDLPGQILFEERGIGGAVFYATSTAGGSFSPSLPSSGTSVASLSEERQNRTYISKTSQVESVPVYRYFDIGSANFPIRRVVALRDGIFFFKQDGIFRISGETFENFTVSLVDNTVTLLAPESAVAFNNQIFFMSTQGICSATDAGVRVMSVPIENTLLTISSTQYTYFSSASFGVAYESARLYLFFTVTEETDEFATQAFSYCSLTDTWTRWIMDRTCGIVNTAVNKLFMAQPDTGQVLIERKSFTNDDYADEEYTVVIASIDSTTEMTLVDGSNVIEGMTLVQGARQVYIDSVVGDVLTVANTSGLTAASAVVYTPIRNTIQWASIDCENPGILKQFSEISLMFRNAAFSEIIAGFSTNVSGGVKLVPIANTSGNQRWGSFGWGLEPWGGTLGGQNVLRTYVPRDKQRGSWLTLSLETNEAFQGFRLQGLSLLFNPMSSRIK